MKNLFKGLFAITSISTLIRLLVRDGSVAVALFTLVGIATLPFRLISSLVAALGSGLTLRGWAAIEFEMWRHRRKGALTSRRQYMTHRNAMPSDASTLGALTSAVLSNNAVILPSNDEFGLIIGVRRAEYIGALTLDRIRQAG